MPATAKSLGIDRLSIDERLALIEEIWDAIRDEDETFALDDATRAELDRRLADAEAHPELGIPWDDVRESILSRLLRREPLSG